MIPFFSIIIPVYNVAPYLRECLDSVLSQTFTEWEAICVDDGSTDGSGAILDKYSAKDERFRIIHKKNEGVSVARNVALDAATGRYIVFVDADDVILRDWLKVFHEVIARDECDIVRADFKYWHGEQDYCAICFPDYSITGRFVERKDICSKCVHESLDRGYSVINCIKRDKIFDVRFPVGVRIMEDCIFSAHVMARASSVSVIDYKGYLYRMRDSSAVHTQGIIQSKIKDLYDLFRALLPLEEDCHACGLELEELFQVRKEITWFVAEHLTSTVLTCFAERRTTRVPKSDYGDLAKCIFNLHEANVVTLQSLPFVQRLSVWLFSRWTCRCGLLFVSKMRTLMRKIANN